MKGGWKLLLLFTTVFVLAVGAERSFVPDVVPIAFADEPQPLWEVGTAFVLRAIELMSGGVAAITLFLMLARQARVRFWHRRAH